MAYSKDKVADLFQKHKEITRRGLAVQYNNTEACQAFYNGDYMNYSDNVQFTDTMGRRRRATVNFQKIQPTIDTVGGFMAQNRRQAKFIARVNGSQEQQLYSKNMNALYTYHRENMNADQIETDQDFDMLINGYGAVETDLSYIVGNATSAPNGEIIKARLDPMRVGWDPRAKGKNLLDARWVWYYDDYDLSDALDLFDNSKEGDFQQVGDDEGTDRGYVYNPYGGVYDKIKADDSYMDWASKPENMVRVYNYQWFEYETFYKAENPIYMTESQIDAQFYLSKLEVIKADAIERAQKDYPKGVISEDLFTFDPLAQELVFDKTIKGQLVEQFGDMISPVSFVRKCYYTAVVSGKHVFTHFKSVSQQGFSVKFKTGVYNEQGKFWIGMVNPMMEPAKYYNKAITEFMFTVAALSKGGVYVEESAVEDIADFEAKQAKTDAVIVVADGALSGGKIMDKARPALPTGIDTIINLSDASLQQNGVDPSMLGDTSGQESGILYKRRIRQAISKLARYFDSVTLYQKEDARLNEDLIRVWIQNNEGATVLITGQDGADQFREISQDMLAAEYSISIQEAPTTPEEHQEIAAMLSTQGKDLMALGDLAAGKTFLGEALRVSSLDGDVKNRLIEALQPAQSVPVQQYQMLEQQLQQMQSQLAQLEAAKIQAETNEKIANAALIQAKTAKELEGAASVGLENDILRSGGYSDAKVSI